MLAQKASALSSQSRVLVIPEASYEKFCAASLSFPDMHRMVTACSQVACGGRWKRACCWQNYWQTHILVILLSQGQWAASCWSATAIHPVLQQLQTVLSHRQIQAVQPVPTAENGIWEQVGALIRQVHPIGPETPFHHSTAASANPTAGHKGGRVSSASLCLASVVECRHRSSAFLIGSHNPVLMEQE